MKKEETKRELTNEEKKPILENGKKLEKKMRKIKKQTQYMLIFCFVIVLFFSFVTKAKAMEIEADLNKYSIHKDFEYADYLKTKIKIPMKKDILSCVTGLKFELKKEEYIKYLEVFEKTKTWDKDYLVHNELTFAFLKYTNFKTIKNENSLKLCVNPKILWARGIRR